VDKTNAGAFVQGDANVATIAAGVYNAKPFQVALAISLRTARAGPGGRGRFYIPVPAGDTVGADGLMSLAEVTGHRDRAKGFLDQVNADSVAAGFGRLVVASGGSITRGVAPALSDVTQVAVGRVFDTIQSRRSVLVEGHVPANLA
jgi:microcompartment protein CcmK/EutM